MLTTVYARPFVPPRNPASPDLFTLIEMTSKAAGALPDRCTASSAARPLPARTSARTRDRRRIAIGCCSLDAPGESSVGTDHEMPRAVSTCREIRERAPDGGPTRGSASANRDQRRRTCIPLPREDSCEPWAFPLLLASW